MRVLTVIVNYRSAPLSRACLESLARLRGESPGLHAVVIDNASGDDSVEVLGKAIAESGWAEWAEVRAMPKNGGFSYGVNAGVVPALGKTPEYDAFWLLNPDTYVRPGALRELTEYLAAHPEVAMVGSRLEDPDGTPQHSRFRFPNLANVLDDALRFGPWTRLIGERRTCPEFAELPHAIDWLSGASMLVRREVFERVGPFDEGYFLYYEELDFCRRAHDVGLHCHYVPASRVVHLVGQTTGVSGRERMQKRMPGYWFDSRTRYFTKHHGRLYKLACDLLSFGGRLAYHVLRTLRRRPDGDPPRFLRDFARHNFVPFGGGSPR
ncbi:MAG: hypothetical protein RL398_3000 [Planctomycetota bacterium]